MSLLVSRLLSLLYFRTSLSLSFFHSFILSFFYSLLLLFTIILFFLSLSPPFLFFPLFSASFSSITFIITLIMNRFAWHHIFIPVLPLSLVDYCSAPMPFVIGLHSSLMLSIIKMPLSEVVYVDLDRDQVLSSFFFFFLLFSYLFFWC